MDNVMIERILQRQIKANESILKELGKVIGEIGELTPSEAYTIAQQLKYGESLDKIVKTLSKYSHINEIEIYKMLEAEAKNNLALKKIYFKAKQIDFIPYKQNKALQNLVNEVAMATVNTYRNISATTGLTYLDSFGKKVTKPIKQAYMDIIDDAIMNISTGKQSFNQAMQSQLETIGKAGIQSIEYESGYHRRIDSAIRMNLQEGLSRLASEQQELLGQQFGADGWEVSVHEAPADDHIPVQGHIFTNEEYAKLQDFGEAKDVNGRLIDIHNKYGSYRPISTLNCYHYAFSIVIGVTKPRYSQEELDKIIEDNNNGFEFEGKHYTKYQGEEMLRRFELEMKKAQETNLLAKAEGNEELASKSRGRMDILARKYYNFSKASGLPTRIERIKNMTINKSKKENIKTYKDITQEMLDTATPNSHKIEYDDTYIDPTGVKHPIPNVEVALTDFSKEVDENNDAEWLEKTFGGELHRVPRITDINNNKKGYPTPDHIFRQERFELKTIKGNSRRTIDNKIKNDRIKADNFVINIEKTKLTDEKAIEYIEYVYNKGDRYWVNKIILRNGDRLIKVFQKK